MGLTTDDAAPRPGSRRSLVPLPCRPYNEGIVSRPDPLDELLKLPVPERSAAAEELLRSLEGEPEDPDAELLWAAELERRAHSAGDGVPAPIVLAEGRARLGVR